MEKPSDIERTSGMEKRNGTGFTRLANAFKCSLHGIGYAYKHESAFRQELALCIFLVPVAFFVSESPIELVLLIGSLLLVLIVECMNSAIEAAIDRISTSIHPLSKQAKDLGSAAVFFSMLVVVLSWSAILLF